MAQKRVAFNRRLEQNAPKRTSSSSAFASSSSYSSASTSLSSSAPSSSYVAYNGDQIDMDNDDGNNNMDEDDNNDDDDSAEYDDNGDEETYKTYQSREELMAVKEAYEQDVAFDEEDALKANSDEADLDDEAIEAACHINNTVSLVIGQRRRSERLVIRPVASIVLQKPRQVREKVQEFISNRNTETALDDEHRARITASIAAERRLYDLENLSAGVEQQNINVANQDIYHCYNNEMQYLESLKLPVDCCNLSSDGKRRTGEQHLICACAICQQIEPIRDLHRQRGISNTVLADAIPNGPWLLADHVAAWIETATSDEQTDFITSTLFNSPLNKGTTTKSTTVVAFVKIIKDLAARHNFTKKAVDDIFIALHDHTDLNLPIKVHTKNGTIIPIVSQYTEPDIRNNTFDACIQQCILYVGKYAELLECPICTAPRYRPCLYDKNRCKNGKACSPFIHQSHKYRFPLQVLIYRSLTIKLIQMCKEAVLGDPMFSYNDTRSRNVDFLTDILDGEATIEHMTDMHETFLRKQKDLIDKGERRNIVEHSLLLSFFYDGDQLYKRDNDSVWPLLASVLNCDPSYRTKLGLGLFYIGMHNMKVGSGAEQMMMDDVLTEELKAGENGILFETRDANDSAVLVFLQFQAVFWNADTKAYEKIYKVKCSNSLQGCPQCRQCHGLTRPHVKTRVFHEGCLHLPMNHALRFTGVSKNLPDGYYGEDETKNRVLGKAISAAATACTNRDAYKQQAEDQGRDFLCHPRVFRGDSKQKVRRQLLSQFSWVSKISEIGDFAEALWIPFNDTRAYEPYTRIKHWDYVESSRLAELAMLDYQVKHKGNKPAKSLKVNGVHHNIYKWNFLKKSLKFHNSAFDYMHDCANLVKDYLKLIAGENTISDPFIQLCLSQGRFLFLSDPTIKQPWFATKESRIRADSAWDCINVPAKYKRDYMFDLPFKYDLYLNSHDKMIFAMTYMEYILSFTDITAPYKRFFARWALDLRTILCPRIAKENLDYMESHVVETKCLSEQMFPDCQMPITKHQLVDIVHHIRRLGPVKNWTCFTGERTMKKLGDTVPDGGSMYIKTMAERFALKENTRCYHDEVYEDNKAKYTDNAGHYSVDVLRMTRASKPLVLTLLMKSMLFDSIQELLISQGVENLVVKSPFARLYFTHKELQESAQGESTPFPADLASWITELHTIYHSKQDTFNLADVNHLMRGIVLNTVTRRAEETVIEYSHRLVNELINAGRVYLSDFSGIITDLALLGSNQSPLPVYKNAIVKGIELSARGAEYAEPPMTVRSSRGHKNNSIFNTKNNLKSTWFTKTNLNSWMKVTDFYLAANNEVRSKGYYCLGNYFLRLYLPSDTLLNGVAFVNAVLRLPVFNADTGVHFISTDDAVSFYGLKQFVPLLYVDSTAIATNAFDTDSLPIREPLKAMKAKEKAVADWPLVVSKRECCQAATIDMIVLQRERLDMFYTSIEEDTENFKVFESELVTYYASIA